MKVNQAHILTKFFFYISPCDFEHKWFMLVNNIHVLFLYFSQVISQIVG